jgi:hypothetical protein
MNLHARKLVKECEACQKIENQQRNPSMPIQLILPS